MPTLAIFQLYRGVNKCYINLDTYKILKYEKILVYKINGKKNKTKCMEARVPGENPPIFRKSLTNWDHIRLHPGGNFTT
jgi:hypothetical protein